MTPSILVVDDNVDTRRILRDVLTSAGYTVLEATTGLEGVQAACRHCPALILMDVHLPELDGYEATRRIKAQPALAHIPILAVTSSTRRGDDVQAVAAGCAGAIAKPFSPRAVLATIQTYLP